MRARRLPRFSGISGGDFWDLLDRGKATGKGLGDERTIYRGGAWRHPLAAYCGLEAIGAEQPDAFH